MTLFSKIYCGGKTEQFYVLPPTPTLTPSLSMLLFNQTSCLRRVLYFINQEINERRDTLSKSFEITIDFQFVVKNMF